MIPRVSLPDEVVTLAQRQAGVISTAQLLENSVTGRVIQRMAKDGTIRRVTKGIYAISPTNWQQMIFAGLLLGGPQCVVGGMAAAYYHELIDEPPPFIDCYVGSRNRRTHPAPWRFIRGDRQRVGAMPTTSMAQSIVDASCDMDENSIVAMITNSRRRLAKSELTDALAAMSKHPKRKLLLDIVAEVSDGIESVLEHRYYRDVELAHRLPAASHQSYPTPGPRVDNEYKPYRVIVELDGEAFHKGNVARGDSARDNAHIVSGFITFRFGWADVTKTPCEVSRQVATALQQRGWTGKPRPCPLCLGRKV